MECEYLHDFQDSQMKFLDFLNFHDSQLEFYDFHDCRYSIIEFYFFLCFSNYRVECFDFDEFRDSRM